MKSPFETLGVSKSATQDEIRNAYRKLAKKYHPDLNPGNKTAEAKFKEINQANELIGTPEARAKFERGEAEQSARNTGPYGQNGAYADGTRYYNFAQSGPGGQRYRNPFAGMDEDVFESIFGAMGGEGGARAGGFGGAPQPEVYQMQVEFEDSIRGVEREIALPSGKRLRVKIPVGIESGKKLRFTGQGANNNDVLVEIQVKPSSQFKRVGDNLETEVSISIADAILGGEAVAQTIDGRISFRVPPGVSSGQKLRAAGKGVPAHGSHAAGDLVATLKIVTPKEVDQEFKEAVKAWRDRQGHQASGGGAHP